MSNNSLLVNMMVVDNTTIEMINNLFDPKHNSGLKQVTIKLVPYIVLEEEKNSFYQWADKYDQWDNNPCTLTEGNEIGGSHTFNIDHGVFNFTKTKHNRK